MKKIFILTLYILFIGFRVFAQQETKVYIKSNEKLGKFYLYVDGKLINRAPQIQVGVVGLEDVDSFDIRVVFQNHDSKPMTGSIKPKKNKTKLYLLYKGTEKELSSKKDVELKTELPIPGDTPASHPAMPNYKGRLGCDYPIEEAVVDQVISEMTTEQLTRPIDYAREAVRTECFTVKQFRKIVDALENEGDKIKLSQLGWYHVYDQENFENEMNDAFEDPTSLMEIMSYVKENQ